MLHSIGAVVAGYAAMVVLVMAGSMAWMAARVPGGLKAMRENMKSGGAAAMPTPPASYLAFNLALSFFAAVLGGWVTRGIAPSAPTRHLLALGAVVIVMGFMSSRRPGSDQQPGWYRFVIPFVGLAGIALSTLLSSGPGG
jgi:hypothetical protein